MTERRNLPNIVIFFPDSMRGDAVSLGGLVNPHIKTPNMDQVAKEDLTFTNCFTVNTVCVPSRCCTFTGQYVHSNGHRGLYQLLQPYEENLFKFLRDNGYNVIWVGRNDLFSKQSGNLSVSKRIKANRRFYYKSNPFPENHYLRKSFYYGKRTEEEAMDIDYYLIHDTLKYLDSKPETPFCLYVSLNFPHPPYTVEEPYFSMYDRDKIPTPIPSKLDDKPEFMHIMRERYGLINLIEDDFKEIIATYYGMITRVDHQLGEILNKLKDIGEYENSAIAIFSDHGDFTGNYGLTEKWPNAFQDCLIRVPLIMKIPGIRTKTKIFEQLVETIDIFPTILDIAQIETPYTHFGKSLIPLIKGEKNEIREAVFAEGGYNLREPQCFETIIKNPNDPNIGIYYEKTNIPKEQPSVVARSVMIRTQLWKLILRDAGKEELYDLKNDPNELHNLIDSSVNVEIKNDLKEQLLRWYLRTSDNSDWKRRRIA
ncbi:MAG: sulfatase-like hydrolase/transferase [Candidatus Lokiarchaeota archaeon]|nr:sulfatase-like hydrolase/transferase [Candidatus Lokiarchaeota archaeon]